MAVSAAPAGAKHRFAKARGWQEAIALAGVVGLAAALRLYQLGFQSLWLDEAASVAFASGDLAYIFAFTFSKEPNPPLYYVLLHYWLALFGNSELAVRSLSALAGIAGVPALYAVGRRLFNPAAGLLGALALAVSPFHIWLSQETRAFALLALAALLTLYALLAALADNRRAWWVAYGVAALAMIYLHLYGFIALATFVLLAPLLGNLDRRRLRSLALATAIPVLLYVPWLLSLLNQFGEPQWRSRVGLLEIVREVPKTLTLGEWPLWGFADKGWIVWAVPPVLAVLFLVRQPRLWRPAAALAIWLVVPILVSWLASYVSPIYAPRYLVVIAPAVCLAVGLGLALVARRFRVPAALLLALLVATTLPVLSAIYTQPLKEDYRAAARYLKEHVQEGDAVVLMAGYIEYAFLYYGLDGETPLGDVGSAAQVPPALAPLADKHPRLWFVQSHYEVVDPAGHAQRWLASRCAVVGEHAVTGIRISELACAPQPR